MITSAIALLTRIYALVAIEDLGGSFSRVKMEVTRAAMAAGAAISPFSSELARHQQAIDQAALAYELPRCQQGIFLNFLIEETGLLFPPGKIHDLGLDGSIKIPISDVYHMTGILLITWQLAEDTTGVPGIRTQQNAKTTDLFITLGSAGNPDELRAQGQPLYVIERLCHWAGWARTFGFEGGITILITMPK